jgi:hypothetical protein
MSIAKDKVLHFTGGLIAGSIGLLFSRYFSPPGIAGVAVLAGALAGVGKEAWDYWANARAHKVDPAAPPPHDVDLWDAVATFLGGLAVAVVFSIAHR